MGLGIFGPPHATLAGGGEENPECALGEGRPNDGVGGLERSTTSEEEFRIFFKFRIHHKRGHF